jgi:pimeloyl-ACP methyl ester carboxylesterase
MLRHLIVVGVVSLAASWADPSPHAASFVSVEPTVKLEVLDWGGSGRPVVFLSGLGNTAHVFDEFAPKLTRDAHVFGITRRGYGASTIADGGYDANRLADDILAVLDTLDLKKPVLIGHSIAGEEMSSIGSRQPERVGGLVYLDATYQYAFDNGKVPTMADLRELSTALPPGPQPSAAGPAATYAAAVDRFARARGFRVPESEMRQILVPNDDGAPGAARTPPRVPQAVQDSMLLSKFTDIRAPVLALAAMPQVAPYYLNNIPGPEARAAADAWRAKFNALKERQLQAFEQGIPGARVVRLADADHYVFITHEADVLREIRSFLATNK